MARKYLKHDTQVSLFKASQPLPLPSRMRPKTFSQVMGQSHLLTENFIRLVESDGWTGLVFWGPPGTGKTTVANLIAEMTHRTSHSVSAAVSGVKEIREVLDRSKSEVLAGGTAHILFIDEVHRLNRSQQDILLPFLEEGTIRFIGATTENPSFEINNAIASRCLVFHFESLSQMALITILERAAKDGPTMDRLVIERIAAVSVGDARRALILLEQLTIGARPEKEITIDDFEKISHSQSLYYDRQSEAHYDTISAFIKSIRGSDPDASVYYLARMLSGGEDPLFIARRLIILASEDIGNANPLALVVATSAFQAVHSVGMPEARIILSQATTYLACSERSNRSYQAIERALSMAKQTGNTSIPHSLRNAPTDAMKEWGYGKDYFYAHDFEKAFVKMQFLPDEIKDARFYHPSDRGTEKRFQDFLRERGKG